MNAPASVTGPATMIVPNDGPRPQLVAGARPKPIVPTDMDQVWRFAQIVQKSGMAPKDMQKAEQITVAIMHGLEVGLSPLMALQRIAVINGRPSIWGDAAIGLVRASGTCEYVQEIISGDGDNMVAICRAKRKGEREPIERQFSVQDARKASLWGKSGPWQQYPKRMLQMRARAFTLRDLFADVLGGLYIAEELEGLEEDRPMKEVNPRPAVRKTDKPELPPEVPAQPEATEAAAPAEVQSGPRGKPLPPVVGQTGNSDGLDIPTTLRRKKAPTPSDGSEAFLAYVDQQFTAAKSMADLGSAWEGLVQPHIESGELPPDDEIAAGNLFNHHKARIEE